MVAMDDIYGEATRGYDVAEAAAPRIRGLIQDAWDLEIHFSGLGIFVGAVPQPPYGVRKILGRFNSLFEAQNFARTWLTGPYGIVTSVSSKSPMAFSGWKWAPLWGMFVPISVTVPSNTRGQS